MPELPSLNLDQKKAVEHGTGPLLIIAGAGTGKTTVVTERIKHLIIDRQVPPSQILALTFTEKAASEMVSRVDEALPYGYTDMWIETFHAFCERILRQQAINIGLNPAFTLMTESENLLFMRKHLFDFDLSYFRPLGNPNKFLQGLLTHFARLKDDDITPQQYISFAEQMANSEWQMEEEENKKEEVEKVTELAKAYETYENLKAKEGVMDFSDLISNTLLLFRSRPSILKEYQERFTYILVDEFQDTNFAQNEMAILLAGEEKNITVVGDDDQSIYRWRGAAIANMLQFRSHFPTAEIVSLTGNYRSTQTILDSAYTLIQHNNPDRLEVRENINKQLTAMRGEKGEEVQFIWAENGDEEAERVAKIIKETAEKTKSPFNDFAILVRANDHALPFQKALTRQQIPFQFLGPGNLFQQEEIKDLIAYLKVLANFEDTTALYRVLTMPIIAFPPRDLAMLMNATKKENLSLFEAMEKRDSLNLTDEGKDKTEKLLTMIQHHLGKITKTSAGQLLYLFCEEIGLFSQYIELTTAQAEKEAENLAKFFKKIQSFETNREDASVFAVVDWIELSRELGESPLSAEVDWANSQAVNILTIHASKGLEFPYVFVVNLVSQRFPGRDRKEQIPVPTELIREELPTGNEHLQEERRLFYVAATRARERLYLTAARYYDEGKRERKISPFVIEMLGQQEIDKILASQKIVKASEQLSLMDVLQSGYAIKDVSKPHPETIGKERTIQPITYISYSQIQTYQMCPLHYKMRYILNVPSASSPALSYGVSVHNSIRAFTERIMAKETLTPDVMQQILKENWLHAGYASKAHEEQTFDQAERMLLRFADTYLREKADTVAIETPFSFPLQGIKVGGRIDRIDRLPDGRIEVIDYKTGSNVPDAKKLKEDLQLTFYALAATETRDSVLGKTPEEVVLTLSYLDEGKKISTTRTKEQLEVAKEKIVSLVSEIERSDFRCSGGIFCKTCEYSMMCSTHK